MAKMGVFNPASLRVLIQTWEHTTADIALTTGISEPRLASCLSGEVEPSLSEVVALMRYFQQPFEVIVGIQDPHGREARINRAVRRIASDLSWDVYLTQTVVEQRNRMGLPLEPASMRDTREWPEAYFTALKDLRLEGRVRNCLARAGCKTLGDVIEIAKAGKLSLITNVGKKTVKQVLDKIMEVTNEDYYEQN